MVFNLANRSFISVSDNPSNVVGIKFSNPSTKNSPGYLIDSVRYSSADKVVLSADLAYTPNIPGPTNLSEPKEWQALQPWLTNKLSPVIESPKITRFWVFPELSDVRELLTAGDGSNFTGVEVATGTSEHEMKINEKVKFMIKNKTNLLFKI